jgi:hypothetical protein
MGEVSRAATQAHRSDGLDHAVRLGLVAYGIVHLMLAWLALQIAFGERGGTASGTGALHALANQPLGAFLIWVVAIGLWLLVVWRLLEAWQGHDGEDGATKVGKQAATLLKAVLYAVLGFSAVKVALGDSKSGSGTDSMTSQLLEMTGGQVIVGLVGLGVVGYGGFYVYRGLTEKYMENLDGKGRFGDAGEAFRWIGKVGHLAKGAAIGVIGLLFIYAAVTLDPKKSGGLDQALQQIAAAPFGQLLLVVVALGIGCYGIYCFARARHLSR